MKPVAEVLENFNVDEAVGLDEVSVEKNRKRYGWNGRKLYFVCMYVFIHVYIYYSEYLTLELPADDGELLPTAKLHI